MNGYYVSLGILVVAAFLWWFNRRFSRRWKKALTTAEIALRNTENVEYLDSGPDGNDGYELTYELCMATIVAGGNQFEILAEAGHSITFEFSHTRRGIGYTHILRIEWDFKKGIPRWSLFACMPYGDMLMAEAVAEYSERHWGTEVVAHLRTLRKPDEPGRDTESTTPAHV